MRRTKIAGKAIHWNANKSRPIQGLMAAHKQADTSRRDVRGHRSSLSGFDVITITKGMMAGRPCRPPHFNQDVVNWPADEDVGLRCALFFVRAGV